jgi:hypothetical protein
MHSRRALGDNATWMTRPTTARVLRIVAGLLALMSAGALGYLIGNRDRQSITTRTGIAYSAPGQASVQTGGWTYDVPLDVPWIDSEGTVHFGARPSCLPAYRRSSIVFGTVNVPAVGVRSVVWVRCSQP